MAKDQVMGIYKAEKLAEQTKRLETTLAELDSALISLMAFPRGGKLQTDYYGVTRSVEMEYRVTVAACELKTFPKGTEELLQNLDRAMYLIENNRNPIKDFPERKNDDERRELMRSNPGFYAREGVMGSGFYLERIGAFREYVKWVMEGGEK